MIWTSFDNPKIAIMRSIFTIPVILVPFFFTFVLSLYFHIPETSKKCFIEEIPDETTVLSKYSITLPGVRAFRVDLSCDDFRFSSL